MLVCILGASGVGKSTQERMLEEQDGFKRVISYTTRPIRGKEIDGVDYHFVTREQFQTLISEGSLLEYAEYRGNLYGTPKLRKLHTEDYVCVCEPVGYRSIRKCLSGRPVMGVYLTIPEVDLLTRKLLRGDMSEEEILNRYALDKALFSGVENEVDLVVKANASPDEVHKQIQTGVQFFKLDH